MSDGSQSSAMNRLVTQLSRLPGIGKRSAQRLAFYLLKQPAQDAFELAAAITDLKRNTRHCSTCFNLTETDPCPICADPKRDHGVILVVEQPSDIATIEATGSFRGVYHVLMGRLSPLDGIGPGELNIDALSKRVAAPTSPGTRTAIDRPADKRPTSDRPTVPSRASTPDRANGSDLVHEVILGLSPTLEGDGTALYLTEHLGPSGVRITRLARGLPTGSTLEWVSKAVLSDSIQGRQPMTDNPTTERTP